MMEDSNHQGHRQRLRAKYAADPASMSQTETLELLLTYAIPRKDVTELAQLLIARFGTIGGVLSASVGALCETKGIGETAAALLNLVGYFVNTTGHNKDKAVDRITERAKPPHDVDLQQVLFTLPDAPEPESAEVGLSTYANDEVANAIMFVPQAAQFDTLDAFKKFLVEKLPYNSINTRQRRANYILNRFYSGGEIETPLTYFAARCTSDELKPVLFYHILRSEPMLARVADEFIWAALPVGYVEREALRRFVLSLQPDLSASSQKNALRSIFVTYDLLSLAQRSSERLTLRTGAAAAASFLYVLTSEFPIPGMHKFEDLERGVMRKWLLWDQESIHQQLYALRDAGLVAKVSEIDNIRQFTLAADQMTLLRQYFHDA